jgi:hypothetical protein
MKYAYRVTITDSWPICPGEVIVRCFPTRKEAQWYADREIEAAKELFTDGRVNLTVKIERERALSLGGTIWAKELGIKA